MYIGQSVNIKRRFEEHKTKGASSRIPLDVAIKVHGADNFLFEVLEECAKEDLNKRESFWIQYYDSISNGYNCSIGGDFQSIGENNGMSKITEEDVKKIRIAYNEHKHQKDIYEQFFKDKISFRHFQDIWQGTVWSHVMPEVFSDENRYYYMYKACIRL